MSNRKAVVLGVVAAGIVILGAYAWYANRTPALPAAQPLPPAMGGAAAGTATPAPSGAPRPGGTAGPAGPVAVEVFKVVGVTLADDVNAVGSIRSNESVMMRPEVAGRIAAINFREGEPVRKGAVLVALDASVNQAEVEQSRAELDLAQDNLKRTEDLARQNFVSTRARDEAASNVRVLQAKLRLAETRRDKMNIVAPFNGVVGIRNVSVGDYVKDGADLVNIEDLSSVKADFRLPERYQPLVHKGQNIELGADALPGQHFPATVDAINPLLDANGRSVVIRARAANKDGALRPGMFARVRLIFSQKQDALVVPEEAVVPQGTDFYVYRVVDGKAMRSRVKLGARRDARVEVLEGVSAGDVVVLAGQLKLQRDGTPVRVIEPAKSAAPKKS